MHDSQKESATPAAGTHAARDYYQVTNRSLGLLMFITGTVVRTDYVARILRKRLGGEDWRDISDPDELAKREPGENTKILRDQKQALLEMFFLRFVHNFECYLVDLLREVLKKQPKVLTDSQPSFSSEYFLQFGTMEELLNDVIESKINNLSYQGFSKLRRWCSERGVPLVVRDEDADAIVELVATRNVLVHSRGVIDRKYVRTVESSRFSIGEVRRLDVDELMERFALLNRTVSQTDQAIAAKFELEQIPLVESSASSNNSHDD